ncbi:MULTISPECIES: hypothetical protein [unclassified Crossiella]|uniref:hypothetical protein n=1 Tax=unclassified Crossiella TaxID=2620835 RepID=UPI001FFEEDC7|nr:MULTISPECIES: hypothetical protein [unclassified Crossiella]MCK2240655.1 hypothetical protein [Crossiella sp. S99.2]MCK2252894.1 hypothetical protein [Crossiella sp. S99.1]
MSHKNVPSWAHPGVIIGIGSKPDRGHGNHWLNQIGPRHWQWIGVNPRHGTYHHKATWAVPVKGGNLPPQAELDSKRHALFLLWGRPDLRAGEPVATADIDEVEAVLAKLARQESAVLDPARPDMVPVLDVLFRAQYGGVHSWVSARHGDLLALHQVDDPGLARIRTRLAEAHLLCEWASEDGLRWAKPATRIDETTAGLETAAVEGKQP